MQTELCIVAESDTLSIFVKEKKHSAGKISTFFCLCECYCCDSILSVSCCMKNSLRCRFPSIIFFRKQT